jgi:threonine synthase
MVSDEEILSAYRLLSAKEGVFVEPASAAGVAGLLKKKSQGLLPTGKKISITVTGNGLKDVHWVLEGNEAAKPILIPNDVHAAAAELGL